MKIVKRLVFVMTLLVFAFASTTKAQAGPTFFYVVTTVDSAGFESVFSNQVSAVYTQGKHITSLSWTAAVVPFGGSVVAGYNVYRGTVSGGPYVKISTTLVTGVTYADTFVLPNAPSGLAATLQ